MNSCEELVQEAIVVADEKIKEFEQNLRLAEVASPPAREVPTTMTGLTPLLGSGERGFLDSSSQFQLQPRQPLASNTALAGSIERLNQENLLFPPQKNRYYKGPSQHFD